MVNRILLCCSQSPDSQSLLSPKSKKVSKIQVKSQRQFNNSSEKRPTNQSSIKFSTWPLHKKLYALIRTDLLSLLFFFYFYLRVFRGLRICVVGVPCVVVRYSRRLEGWNWNRDRFGFRESPFALLVLVVATTRQDFFYAHVHLCSFMIISNFMARLSFSYISLYYCTSTCAQSFTSEVSVKDIEKLLNMKKDDIDYLPPLLRHNQGIICNLIAGQATHKQMHGMDGIVCLPVSPNPIQISKHKNQRV